MMDKNAKIASEDSLKEIPLLKNLLNHYQSLCESHDSEMLDMLEVLDKTRINWKTATLDCLRLRAMLESLERENKNIITELRSTQEKLREGQAKNAALDSTNRDLAVEIEQYKRMFDTVKAILKEDCGKYPVKEKLMELPFFTDKRSMPQPGGTPASSREPSLATTDDIDYDKTGDSFADAVEEQVSEGGSSNARYGRANPRRSNRLKQQTNHRSSKTTKRRSASQQPLRPNGNKFSEVVITEEEENASDAPCPTPSKRRYEKAYVQPKTISSCKPSVAVRSSMNRSFSESNILDERRNPQSARVGNAAGSTIDIRSPLVGFGNCWTKGQKISECGHNFVLTRSLFSGTCNVCLKGWAMCLTSKTLKCQGRFCAFTKKQ